VYVQSLANAEAEAETNATVRAWMKASSMTSMASKVQISFGAAWFLSCLALLSLHKPQEPYPSRLSNLAHLEQQEKS
jgi:hypothetical protein